LHWQEGNRVSVTVFPCTSKEVRMLKIGYTTPLQVNNNKLVYKDIFVEGPVFDRCRNDVHIASRLNLHDVKSSSVNLESGADMLTAQFTGDRDWDLQLPYTPLAAQSFSFNHQSFRLAEEKNDPTAFTAENIVLDINAGWTKKEFTALISASKNKKVWYASDENTLSAIDGNAEQVWNTMSRKNFQLIPFHKVDPGNTVLIVKPALNAPSYRDLDSSAYAIKLAQSVQRSVRPLHCFKINTPDRDLLYSTLNDMQYLAVHPLSLDACLSALQKGTIDRPYADEQSVNIDDANMNIVRSYSDSNSGAPDHLMRLFYYKKILSQSAGYYFSKTNDAALQPCVQMANDAFIVSPVSSLIVLETDSDYNAMGIDQNSGSLLNATKKGKGAVPEPHEWVLLIFGTLALLVLIGRQTKMI
ncbi:MAG: XrtN system VIT domain-containing protein, partial [Chitinophagaceae bacterium]|nr:XrtN system VIT domain-containing protein [Chitinophagaceae bacterium]